MSNVIIAKFGTRCEYDMVRQAYADIEHGPKDVICTNGKAVQWMQRPRAGYKKFGAFMTIVQPEPPCAA